MLRFKVIPDGGDEFEVVATTRDIWKWEKTTKGASFGGLKDDMHMVDLYKIAYHASVRQGLWSGTPAEFEDGCDLDILKGPGDQEDEDVDPTQPAPPDESS